jgi:hypothetical protein
MTQHHSSSDKTASFTAAGALGNKNFNGIKNKYVDDSDKSVTH